jgi:hypothetical protein
LKEFISKGKIRKTFKKEHVPKGNDDVTILGDSDSTLKKIKMKFCKFHDNIRPAYYGNLEFPLMSNF